MQPSRQSFLADLADLAICRSEEMRPTLARVLTDLFVGRERRHSPEEIADFGELMDNLLDRVEPHSRRIIAEKLARRADAPPALVARLAAEPGAVSAPLLARSPLLEPARLLDIAKTADEAALAGIARRSDLGTDLARRLAQRGGEETHAALLANDAVRLPSDVAAALRLRAGTAPPPEMLQANAVDSADLPAYLAATPEGRRRLVAALEGRAEAAPVRPVASVLSGNVGRVLADHAVHGRMDEMKAMLAEFLDIPASVAARVLDDPHGEPLVVAAIALRLDEAAMLTLLIHANPEIGRSVGRVHALYGLTHEMAPETADALVQTWRGEPLSGQKPERQGHGAEPYLSDAVSPRAREPKSTPKPARETKPGRDRAARRDGERRLKG